MASSGDSRCICLKKNHEVLPLTDDHKPEDPRERERIYSAGGKITEGRVNGGLNLSRAFGDFTYKNEQIEPQRQMISPVPDVTIVDLLEDEPDYIFLACDGIWNSMETPEVAEFIRNHAPRVQNDLVEINMRLFKKCLAPTTYGDGSGCDNMTSILVKFGDVGDVSSAGEIDLNVSATNKDKDPSRASTDPSTNKRPAADDERDGKPICKRQRCMRLLKDTEEDAKD